MVVLCSYDKDCEDRDPTTRECKANYTCNQQARPHQIKTNGETSIMFLRRSDVVLLEALNVLSKQQPTKPKPNNNGVR